MKRSRASIYVQTPECAFVVDTGPDFRGQCLRERVGRVDAVLLSHSHTDHIMGFDDLRRFSDLRRVENLGGLPVFAAPAHLADLQRVFAFAFDPKYRFPGYLHVVPHVIEKPFRLGETTGLYIVQLAYAWRVLSTSASGLSSNQLLQVD